MAVFVCGPLADPAVLGAVCGDAQSAAAELPGFRLTGGAWPALAVAPQATITGRVIRPAEAASRDRLDYLAAVLGLTVSERRIRSEGAPDRSVAALLPAGDTQTEGQAGAPDWDAAQFDDRHAAYFRAALPEILSGMGRVSPEECAGRLRVIFSRADSAVTAAAHYRQPESGLDIADVKVLDASRPYSNFFAVTDYRLTHARFDGKRSPELARAVWVAADAVTVLPYDPVRDRVLLVEQFRLGPLGRGDRSPWLLEPIAGRIEPGDTPEETARKESGEEAGLTLKSLHYVSEYYPSTGTVSEYIYSYVGLADLPDDAGGLCGAEAENEDIRTHVMPRAVFFERLVAGDMPNGPLILTAYWLEANLSRLRGIG